MSVSEQQDPPAQTAQAAPPPLAVLNRTVVIAADHRLSLEVELPPECPTGEFEVTLTFRPSGVPPRRNRIAEMRGVYAGQIWVSDDFDAPLDDFREYM